MYYTKYWQYENMVFVSSIIKRNSVERIQIKKYLQTEKTTWHYDLDLGSSNSKSVNEFNGTGEVIEE